MTSRAKLRHISLTYSFIFKYYNFNTWIYHSKYNYFHEGVNWRRYWYVYILCRNQNYVNRLLSTGKVVDNIQIFFFISHQWICEYFTLYKLHQDCKISITLLSFYIWRCWKVLSLIKKPLKKKKMHIFVIGSGWVYIFKEVMKSS